MYESSKEKRAIHLECLTRPGDATQFAISRILHAQIFARDARRLLICARSYHFVSAHEAIEQRIAQSNARDSGTGSRPSNQLFKYYYNYTTT